MKKRWMAAGAALALCAGLLAGCSQEEAGEWVTVYPDRGPVKSLVEDTGTLAYGDEYSILPAAAGKVTLCEVEEGQQVEAGQVLYTIDSGDLEDQITQAALSLDSARESLSQAQAACADLTVCSQAAGMVSAVYCHVGDFVSQGSPVADVVDSFNLTLTVPFAAQDAEVMTAGDLAVITFPGRAGSVTGSVERVYDVSSVLSGGREGVYVQIRLTNPGSLEEGTQATAQVGGAACMEAGEIRYATSQSIYATQSGQVETLNMEEGTAVTVGQTVLTLKNDSLTNAVSNAALSVDSAQVNLRQLQDKLADYTVTAPADGVIISRSVKLREYASVGVPLATLAEEDALQVNAEIDEIYIGRIFPGQQARVSFTDDSGEERIYDAQVRRVDDTGVSSGGVTNYTVELALADTAGLKAGMNVWVSIVTGGQDDCLRLPAAAVSAQNTVQVLREGKAVEVPVETGLTGGGYVQILSGVTQEDEVILP